MALSLGTLFVKLNADPSALVNGLNAAAGKVEQFGQRLNQTSERLTKLGMALTTVGVASVAAAAQFDAGVKQSVDDLKNTFANISVEIGRAFMPAMNVLNDVMKAFANVLKEISPETKQLIASVIGISGVVLLAAGAVTKLVALFTTLAPLLSSVLAPVLAFIAAKFLVITAVILGVVAVAVILANEWDRIMKFIADTTQSVGNFITDAWDVVKKHFRDIFNGIAKGWNTITKYMFDGFRIVAKGIAEQAVRLGKVFGVDLTAELETFNKKVDEIADAGFKPLEEAASNAGSAIKKYMGESWDWTVDKFSGEWDFIVDYAKKGLTKIADAAKSKLAPIFDKLFKDMPNLDRLGGGGGAGAGAGKPSGRTADTITLEEIEILGRMPKKVEENAKQVSGMSDFITNQVMSVMGELGTLFQVIEAGMAAGGPWGALAGAIIYLVGRTKEFQMFVQELMGILDVLSTELGLMLAPLFKGLSIVLKALTPVISGFLKLLGGPLFYVFKHLGLMLAFVGIVIAEVGNAFAAAFAFVMQFTGELLNSIMAGSGDTVIALAEYTRSQMIATGELYKMATELQGLTLADFYNREQIASFPGLGALGDAATQTAGTLERLNDALTNVPAGFKVAAARFNATSPNLYLETRSQPLQVDLNLDGKTIYQSIIALDVRKNYVQDGRLRYKPSI